MLIWVFKSHFCFYIFSVLFHSAWLDQNKFSEVFSILSQVAGKVQRMSTQVTTVVEDGREKMNDFLKNRTESILTQIGRRQSQTSRDISTANEQLILQARKLAALSVKMDELLSFKQQFVRNVRKYYYLSLIFTTSYLLKPTWWLCLLWLAHNKNWKLY